MNARRCPRCRVPYSYVSVDDPHRQSRDHILPQVRGGKFIIHGDTRNIEIMCQACNGWRASCGHCWGLAACIDAVARDLHVTRETILRRWRVPMPKQPPAHDKRASFQAVQIGRAVNRGGADEYIWPADTAAKRVWNLATLAKYGYRGAVPKDLL